MRPRRLDLSRSSTIGDSFMRRLVPCGVLVVATFLCSAANDGKVAAPPAKATVSAKPAALPAPASSDASAAPTLRWYKGNLHTHSLWSDGDDFPEMIVDWYKSRGYHFLALSDHNTLQTGEKW